MAEATEDLFTPVHKGLRALLYHLSTRLQQNDFADLERSRALAVDLENDFALARSAGCALCLLARHATDEESAIFSAGAIAAEPLVATLIAEHHDLTRRELEIQGAAHALLTLPSPDARIAAGVGLNQRTNQLIAAYLAHMDKEEAELVPLMRARLTDAEMAEMRTSIIRHFPFDRLRALLEWMLPALNVTELSSLLAGIGPSPPPPLVQAVREIAASKIDPRTWNEVRARTGFAA